VQLAELSIAAELGSTGAIKEAVKGGGCVSFISRLALAAELESGTLAIARVPELGTIARTYHTVFSRRRVISPISRAFLDYLRKTASARPRATASATRRASSRKAAR
jgi:DNA-binding transcriptional LysR family regulator